MSTAIGKRRRGTSLVEALVIIAVGSVVMGGVTTGIATLLRVNSRITQADDDRHLLTGLARQLRQDLHAAQEVSWDDSQSQITITGDQTVKYRWLEDKVERTEQDIVTPWRLPDGFRCQCDPESASAMQVVEITLAPAKPGKPLRLVTCVGRDLPNAAQEEDSP